MEGEEEWAGQHPISSSWYTLDLTNLTGKTSPFSEWKLIHPWRKQLKDLIQESRFSFILETPKQEDMYSGDSRDKVLSNII